MPAQIYDKVIEQASANYLFEPFCHFAYLSASDRWPFLSGEKKNKNKNWKTGKTNVKKKSFVKKKEKKSPEELESSASVVDGSVEISTTKHIKHELEEWAKEKRRKN